MHQPHLVSIIITAQIPIWLDETLRSAVAQDYERCEIIVADFSDDKFVNRCVQPWLKREGHPVKLINTASGYHKAVEQAIQVSRGSYLKFVSDADVLDTQCVSSMLAGLLQAPQAEIAVTKRNLIDAHGDIMPDLQLNASLMSEPAIFVGHDVLRYQTTLEYNLLGELSATLISRSALIKCMLKKEALFKLENEIHADILPLVLYSKLLLQGDVVWLPQPLCSIRHSDVYSQPHQRESKDRVREQRKTFNTYICKSDWFKNDSSPREQVNAALLSSPSLYEKKNLRTQQQQNISLNVLSHWRQVRKIEPYQHQQLAEVAKKIDQPATLSIIIDDVKDNHTALQRTLTSLRRFTSPLLTLQVVIVGYGDYSAYPHAVMMPQQSVNTALNTLVNQTESSWLMLVDAGAEFQESGLIALGSRLTQEDTSLAIYADEFFIIQNEAAGVLFRPAFNLDMLLSSPKTMAQHWIFRRELLIAAEGLDAACGESAELDLILKLIVSQGLDCVGHMAEPLLTATIKKRDIVQDARLIQQHLHHRGYNDAEIDLDQFHNYRLRYNHVTTPKISIVILASGSLPVLITCITSLMEKTRYQHYELLIVTDNQASAEREAWLRGIAEVDPQLIRVLQHDSDFNRSAMVNLAATQAKGEYLLLMHYELAVTDVEWLNNLINHGQRPEVAIVGGKQLTSDNKIRHAGYVLGINGAAGEVFRGHDDQLPTVMARLHIDQNYSAVSGDFMLIRLAVFQDLGGFDGDNRLFDDVDFCLKVRDAGYLVVWTPYARILRSAARQTRLAGESLHSSAKIKQSEEDKLFQRWMPLIARDPAYNPNLSLRSRHFDISNDSKLSWQPIAGGSMPKIIVNNADTAGCGYYRMLKPIAAMKEASLALGHEGMTMLTLSEIAQYKPDSLVIQRRYSTAFHNWIERVSKMHQVFKVFELDDYILELPAKHNNRASFKADVPDQLRKSLSYFDRFVVSTVPLAEALHDFHPDIQVMPNRLPVDWWGNVHSLRGQGRKPRVGWAGGSSHQGDLEMIAEVVKTLANEVEWVFMGMCPDSLRPYVREFHRGVDISLYPAKLASLNLDLALAPVEDNIFNICKSNLRVMEYGACGVPVICSDVECYRHTDLPVTRVQNTTRNWIEAIRMHLSERDHSENTGLMLQTMLRKDWMLAGENMQHWLAAWKA